MPQPAPLVSVVTPMYNESTFVAECIQSILGQTYENWEYIIVDNCSTDSSAEIAERYAAQDPRRIRVVRNDSFLSALANHNAAVQHISESSKYCKIVFADDWIFPECLQRMVAVAESHPTVGIVGAYGLEGEQVVWTGLPFPSTVTVGRNVCRRLFLDGLYVFGTATSLLYRAELVRGRKPFFDESDIHSDMDTCISLLKSSDFGFVHQVLTFTRPRESSRITLSRKLNTLLGSKLRQLIKHGQQLLTEEEFKHCFTKLLSDYYWYLGRSALGARGEAFWQYHKQVFRDAGLEFRRARLAGAVLGNVCSAFLNLQSSIERVLLRAGMAPIERVGMEPGTTSRLYPLAGAVLSRFCRALLTPDEMCRKN